MADKAPPKAPAKKSGFIGFLESPGPMGLPWVVWGVVLVGAAVVGYFWYRNQQGANAQGSGSTGSATNSSQDANALGLAIDPTTGLPYAVEGLVPSGGTVDSGSAYAAQLNLLQQEITALQSGTTPPPSSTTTTTGTTTTPITYTPSGKESLETIAEHWYGVADNSAQLQAVINAIIAANPSLKGDTGASDPASGTAINLPSVTSSGSTYTPTSPALPTTTTPAGGTRPPDKKKK